MGCSTSSPNGCDRPEGFTIRRIENSMTWLTTHKSFSDARSEFRRGGQRSILLNSTAQIVDTGDNCGNRDDFDERALSWLTEITECKYPHGSWKRIFAEINPKSSFTYEEEVTIGRSFTQSTKTQISQSFKIRVGQGPFRASSKFKFVYESSSSATWEQKDRILKRWEIQRGKTVAAWKYVLVTKCFNTVGQFLDEVTFETNIQMQTDKNKAPSCDPNNPGECSGLEYD